MSPPRSVEKTSLEEMRAELGLAAVRRSSSLSNQKIGARHMMNASPNFEAAMSTTRKEHLSYRRFWFSGLR